MNIKYLVNTCSDYGFQTITMIGANGTMGQNKAGGFVDYTKIQGNIVAECPVLGYIY